MTKAWEQVSTSMDDVPVMFGWDAADRFSALFAAESEVDRRQMALKALSEFAYRRVDQSMVGSEPMAVQLEAMAGYVRRNMK